MARRLHPRTYTEIAERLDAALARRTEKEADETINLVVADATELRELVQTAVKDAIGDALATLLEQAKKEATGDRLMTSGQLAEYLGVSKSTIHNWTCTQSRRLPEIRVGKKQVRFRKRDIDAWLEQMIRNPVERLGDTPYFAPRRKQKMKWMK